MSGSIDSTRADVVVTRELGAWRESWDELVERAPVPSPFLRSWWLEAVGGVNLRFLLVVEDGVLIGGLAVERRRRIGLSQYRFASSGVLCPDHLDLLSAVGRLPSVASAVRAWLNRPGSRLLDLRGLVEDSALKVALDTARVTPIDVAPWEPLPGAMSEYLGARSAGFRRQARTTSRRLADLGVQHHRVTAREFDLAMRDFRALHTARGDRTALLAQLPRLENALAAGLARGEIEIHVLRAGSDPVAVSLSFLVAGRLSLYQSARSFEHKYRNATLELQLEVISQACAVGCREVDLLRGSEPYKASYAGRERQIYRLRAAHGALGHLCVGISLGADHLRNLLRAARRGWGPHHGRDRESGHYAVDPTTRPQFVRKAVKSR